MSLIIMCYNFIAICLILNFDVCFVCVTGGFSIRQYW